MWYKWWTSDRNTPQYYGKGCVLKEIKVSGEPGDVLWSPTGGKKTRFSLTKKIFNSSPHLVVLVAKSDGVDMLNDNAI